MPLKSVCSVLMCSTWAFLRCCVFQYNRILCSMPSRKMKPSWLLPWCLIGPKRQPSRRAGCSYSLYRCKVLLPNQLDGKFMGWLWLAGWIWIVKQSFRSRSKLIRANATCAFRNIRHTHSKLREEMNTGLTYNQCILISNVHCAKGREWKSLATFPTDRWLNREPEIRQVLFLSSWLLLSFDPFLQASKSRVSVRQKSQRKTLPKQVVLLNWWRKRSSIWAREAKTVNSVSKKSIFRQYDI